MRREYPTLSRACAAAARCTCLPERDTAHPPTPRAAQRAPRRFAWRSLPQKIQNVAVEFVRVLDHGPVARAREHDKTAFRTGRQDLLVAADRHHLIIDAPEAEHRAPDPAEVGCHI